MPVKPPIRVLVADDDPLIRMIMAAVAARDPALELVAEAEDAEQAVELAGLHRPDVALLDLDMPNGGGVHAALAIRERCPGVRVVALSASESAEARNGMAEAGAVDYVVKGASPEEIARVLHGAVDG